MDQNHQRQTHTEHLEDEAARGIALLLVGEMARTSGKWLMSELIKHPEASAHVLYRFATTEAHQLAGQPGGGFTNKLVDLLAVADVGNQLKLARAFPAYTAAVVIAKNAERGMDFLARNAARRAIPAEGTPDWDVLDAELDSVTDALVRFLMPTDI